MILADAAACKALNGTPLSQRWNSPVDVELPHKLGREEARRRIANNIHKLQGSYSRRRRPGRIRIGRAMSSISTFTAMGQKVAAQSTSRRPRSGCRVMLPGCSRFFAGAIEAALNKKGSVLFEDHRNLTLPFQI